MSNRSQSVLAVLQRVVKRQIQTLQSTLDGDCEYWVSAAEMLKNCQGRIIFTGIGKMGAIGRKAASTFSSTGTPAIFVHPSEAVHGDLGMITAQDLLFVLSYSGETDEVQRVVEAVQPWQIPVLAITKSSQSSLGKLADIAIEIEVAFEGTDLVAVPSCSTTVAMTLCDALAIAVMESRGFTADDFSIFHPGGTLGRNLRTTVDDLMRTGAALPVIQSSQTLREAIVEVSSKGVGAALVVDDNHTLVGILTDGDIRRLLQQQENPLPMEVENWMTRAPKTCSAGVLAAKALRIMEEFRISVLPITCDSNKILGVVHLHDIVSARIG